jgi:hypothetical protein
VGKFLLLDGKLGKATGLWGEGKKNQMEFSFGLKWLIICNEGLKGSWDLPDLGRWKA